MTNDKYEKNYRSKNKGLAAYFNSSTDDISEEDLNYAYPLQYDLSGDTQHYTEHEVIAEGGVKRIIRVTDSKTERSVAKAVLLNKSDRESVEAFLREARLTSSLQHPNIVPIYDMGVEDDGSPYFIMEHLTGDTLGDVIKKLALGDEVYKARYPLSALLEIFSRICNAVAYAHSRNVIHLDLKPENIHINDYGQVHVCDWGLGKILNTDGEPELFGDSGNQPDLNIINNMTLNSQLKGTPGFMAPEQAIANGQKDKPTDVYALGALLYNMLSYKLPIEGESIEELIANTKSGKIIPLDNIKFKIPESLTAVTYKALQTDPSKRYLSLEALSLDLDKYRHGFATSAENAGFITQLKLLINRNKATTALIAVFGVISLLAGILAFNRIDNERRSALSAKIEAEEQQSKAEESLKMYLKERQLTEKQGKNIDQLLYDIAGSQDLSNPQEQIAVLEQGLYRNINENNKNKFYLKLAILHFIQQKFNSTIKYIRLAGKQKAAVAKLLKVCQDYGKLKADDDMLKDGELADIINYLSHTQRYIIPSLFYLHMRRTKGRQRLPKNYWPLAKAMLTIVNNYWNTEPLERELVPFKDGYSLDLSNTRYRVFRSHSGTFGVSILAPLKLRSLNLSHTPFFEFWQIQRLRLKELNITGCWIREIHLKNLVSLKRMGIKKITIDSSLYKEESMTELKKYFEVIDVKGSGLNKNP